MQVERVLDRLHGAVDPGAIAARGREQHAPGSACGGRGHGPEGTRRPGFGQYVRAWMQRPIELDRERLAGLLEREQARFAELHPASRRLFEQAQASLLAGVPMSWMAKWAGGHPVYVQQARGATITDVDGNSYVDLCLGDTGAMAGHSPAPTVAAVAQRLGDEGGAALMLPTSDAAAVGAELARRFGVALWSFTLSATDANRFAIRLCRQLTARPRILVFNWCYHGSVDETFITLEGDRPRAREGNVGPPVDPAVTTRVCEFNDLEALERELAHGDVACVLAEPALTNIGIVLPEAGFHERLRRATRDAGTLLIIDETHTISAGPGGCTEAWGLEPDVVTLGKWVGGGVPVGAYGVGPELAERIESDPDADYVDTGGVGGTLAGNALSLAAARATLDEVLTAEAFAAMTDLCGRFVAGCEAAIAAHGLGWSVVQLGARAEYVFTSPAPRTGADSAAASDPRARGLPAPAAAERGSAADPVPQHGADLPGDDRGRRRSPHRGLRRRARGSGRLADPGDRPRRRLADRVEAFGADLVEGVLACVPVAPRGSRPARS